MIVLVFLAGICLLTVWMESEVLRQHCYPAVDSLLAPPLSATSSCLCPRWLVVVWNSESRDHFACRGKRLTNWILISCIFQPQGGLGQDPKMKASVLFSYLNLRSGKQALPCFSRLSFLLSACGTHQPEQQLRTVEFSVWQLLLADVAMNKQRQGMARPHIGCWLCPSLFECLAADSLLALSLSATSTCSCPRWLVVDLSGTVQYAACVLWRCPISYVGSWW